MSERSRAALRYNVRALLPGPESALRDAVLQLGISVSQLQVLARHAAVEAFTVEGLRPDQIRVLERTVRDGGGEVLSNPSGDHAVVLAPLLTAGQLAPRLAEWSEAAGEVGAAISAAMTARGTPAPLRAGPHTLRFDARTLVMGIVNVTPDSFAGDGVGDDVGAAVARAQRLVDDGADIIDIGAESTRPGSIPVDAGDELRRLLPVLQQLRDVVAVPISVDTHKASVARVALQEGAHIINDIWGLREDRDMAPVIAAHPDSALIVMHNQRGTEYGDMLGDVTRELRCSMAIAADAGIAAERIVCDPGFGFGKTPAQNLELLRRLAQLRSLGRPVLAGLSRKSTIGALLGGVPPAGRVQGSVAMAVLAVQNGAHIVRVHDVAETVRALKIADAVVRGTPASVATLAAPGPTG